jgi:H+-transporting ATPase
METKYTFETKPTSEYKNISLESAFKSLNSSGDGLNSADAGNRLDKFGYNELIEKKRNLFLEFIQRYWGPMPWLLELAMGLSFILRHYLEGIIIFTLLTMNAIIGHMHARGSQKAMELLKKRLAIKAKILRDGKWTEKEAREIVPGDVMAVKLGDIVPADAKIIAGELSVDESALTGESLPVKAQKSDIIYSGSVVRQGEARSVIVNTGANTYFGKTAELVKIAKPNSHQQQVMMAVVKYMMYLAISASMLIFIYALSHGIGILTIFTFAVIFLMGAVPVALPAVLTIVQAVGAMELVKKGVLVTRLDSIEDAASIDVLCLDKTGTITQNKLSLTDYIPFLDYNKEDVIAMASLASKEEGMDIIDIAIIEYGKSIGINFTPYKQVSYTPFNPSIKRTEAIIETNGKRFKVVKGAAQIIISLCQLMDKDVIHKATETIESFSQKGYRAIAVAKSEDDSDNFNLVGLLALSDPPRPDSKAMIDAARKHGIKPIMLTGDNIAIARQIATEVGIGNKIIHMSDIKNLTENEQVKIVEESDGIAEIYPEDKYMIVKLLQSRGHMVGMTGDGVNDAPALKQAEMGIAVYNATDVAKASASVVLTEEGISVIIDAINISRQIYQRMLSWVLNKVTKVIEFVGLLTVCFIWLDKIVLSLLGMSLLVFANDFVTMSLATDNVKHTSNPNNWNVRNITLASLIPGILLVFEGIIVIHIGLNYFNLEWDKIRTMVMLNLIFNSQFRVLIMRERRHFWSSLPSIELFSSSIVAIIGFALLGLYGGGMSPLSMDQIMVIFGFSAIFTLAIDFPKYYMFKKFEL